MATRRDRSIFSYMEPSTDGSANFAQCASCQLFVEPQERCYWFQNGFKVHAEDSCNFYVDGKPVNHDLDATNSLTPKEAGFVHGKVRCENCTSFDGKGKCLLFETLNRAHSDVFDLDEAVKPKGCCNAFSRAENVAKRASGGRVADKVKIDTAHDVRWLSEMSKDGTVFYRDRSLPKRIRNNGKMLDIDEPLLRHETEEYAAIKKMVAEFKEKYGREPDDADREKIYSAAHEEHGETAEHNWLREHNFDIKAWEAWCHGQITRLERKRMSKEPSSVHVRLSPHDRRKLEATL